MGCRIPVVTTDERPVEGTDDAVLLPSSDINAIPLTNASAACVRQQLSAGFLGEDVEKSVSFERCSNFLRARSNQQWDAGTESRFGCLLDEGGGTAEIFV